MAHGRTFHLSVFLAFLAVGCASSRRTAPIATTQPSTQFSSIAQNTDVDAFVAPPLGWTAQPLKSSSRHTHQIWLAPSGNTAYGVIHFSLPFPVGYDLVLWGFLREMKRTQGESILVSKEWDKNLEALRFVADGGVYRVRVNLFVDGWRGWAVYAGTLRDRVISQEELELAEIARDHTIVGIKAADR